MSQRVHSSPATRRKASIASPASSPLRSPSTAASPGDVVVEAGSPTLQTIQAQGWGQGGVPFAGAFAHLAVASFYGLLWGPAWRWLHHHSALPGWMLGVAYGILLFALAQSLAHTLPASLQVLNANLLLAAHCVYGFTLGAVSQ